LQDAVVPTIQMVDVATEMNNGIIERETQTDLLHVRNEYERYINKYKIQIFSDYIYCYNVIMLIGAKIYHRQQ